MKKQHIIYIYIYIGIDIPFSVHIIEKAFVS